MTQIAGKPFTQLVNLNILDELRVNSTLVDGYIIERFTTAGTITSNADLAFSTGTHTLIMPLINKSPVTIKSISGTATLDPGTNTFEGTDTVTATLSRDFILDGTVWREI